MRRAMAPSAFTSVGLGTAPVSASLQEHLASLTGGSAPPGAPFGQSPQLGGAYPPLGVRPSQDYTPSPPPQVVQPQQGPGAGVLDTINGGVKTEGGGEDGATAQDSVDAPAGVAIIIGSAILEGTDAEAVSGVDRGGVPAVDLPPVVTSVDDVVLNGEEGGDAGQGSAPSLLGLLNKPTGEDAAAAALVNMVSGSSGGGGPDNSEPDSVNRHPHWQASKPRPGDDFEE